MFKTLYLAAGSLIILLLAVFQGLGLCQRAELFLVSHLPNGLRATLPSPPQVVLISLEKSSDGKFQPLDVAMALRGLGKFHPLSIAISGPIAEESTAVPLLPAILSDLNSKMGIHLVLTETQAPATKFRAVPLLRYSLRQGSPLWPTLEGEALPGSGDAFSLKDKGQTGSLPLLAFAKHNVPIGSIWWWMLPRAVKEKPPLLLFQHFLLLDGRTPLRLNSDGSSTPPLAKECLEMPLDDFLLQMEKKEQGTLSPTFDALWEKSIVLLGSSADLASASEFAALLDASSRRHPSLPLQALLAIAWILLFLLFQRIRLSRWIPSLALFVATTTATILLLSIGITFPFLPPLAAAVLLLIF